MNHFKKELEPLEISKGHKLILISIISMGGVIIFQPIYLRYIFYESFLIGLNIDNQQLGSLVGIFGILAAILYIPSGILADKVRMRTLAILGFISTALLVFWYAMLPPYEVLLFIFGVLAITTILIWWGIRFKLIRLISTEEEYPRNIGISFGLYGFAGLIYNLLTLIIFNAISDERLGIQIVIFFTGGLILIFGILSIFFIPKFRGEIKKENKVIDFTDFKKAITNKGVLLTAVSMFFIMFFYMGMSYSTPYLTKVYGAPLVLVSIIGMTRNYGLAMVSSPFFGKLAKQSHSPAKIIIYISGITALCFLGFILLPKESSYLPIVVGVTLILGFVGNGGFALVSSQLTETHVPIEIFGAGAGIISAIGFFPESFMHKWFGSMIDRFGENGFMMIFAFLMICSLISIFISGGIRRYVKKITTTHTSN
ncbi:MAG: MFS transporter [Eubacteriaceae bacterium]